MKSKIFSRIIAILLCLSVVFANLVFAVAAEETTSDPIILVSGSDFQIDKSTTDDLDETAITEIFTQIKEDYSSIDGFLFAGDYTTTNSDSASAIAGLTQVQGLLANYYSDVDNTVWIQGNHEPTDLITDGYLATTGAHDTDNYGVYVLNEDDYPAYGNHGCVYKTTAPAFETYLTEKAEAGYTKPIFVVSHVPLHYTYRTYSQKCALQSALLVNSMNEAAEAGLNIIFMYAHNHNNGYDDHLGGDQVFLTKGDTINVPTCATEENWATAIEGGTYDNLTWQETEIQFTYLNAGYTAVYYAGQGSTSQWDTSMVVYEITDDEVTFYRYGREGKIDLKAAGQTANPSDEYAPYEPDVNTVTYGTSYTLSLTGEENTVLGDDVHLRVDLVVEDKLGYSFYAYGDDLSDYAKYEIVVDYGHYGVVDGVYYQNTTNTVTYTPSSKASQTFTYKEVAAYEMMCDTTFTLNCYDSTGEVACQKQATISYASLLATAMSQSNKYLSAYIDIINYGAAAQAYFANENPDTDLAADTAANGLPTDIAGVSGYQKYATSDNDASINTADGTGFDATIDEETQATISASMQIQSSNRIVFVVDPGTAADNLGTTTTTTKELVKVTEITEAGNYVFVNNSTGWILGTTTYGDITNAGTTTASASGITADTTELSVDSPAWSVTPSTDTNKYTITNGDDVTSLAPNNANVLVEANAPYMYYIADKDAWVISRGNETYIKYTLQPNTSGGYIYGYYANGSADDSTITSTEYSSITDASYWTIYQVVETETEVEGELKLNVYDGETLLASTALSELDSVDGKYYYFPSEDEAIALYDTEKVITAKLLNGDSVVVTRDYSVEAFIARVMATSEDDYLIALGDAIMKLNYSINNLDNSPSYELQKVDTFETGKDYVLVNKATGTVLTNTLESGTYWYFSEAKTYARVDGTLSLGSDTWSFVDYDGDTTTTGDYGIVYPGGGYLILTSTAVDTHSSLAWSSAVSIVYDEDQQAFQLYRAGTNSEGTEYKYILAVCKNTDDERICGIGCSNSTFDDYSYWEMYEIVETESDNTGDDNTGDDNTGDDNTGDDNTGDATTQLSAVTSIETGKDYVIVNKATGTVLTNTVVEGATAWYDTRTAVQLGSAPTVDSDTWSFVTYSDGYAIALSDGSGYLSPNTVNVHITTNYSWITPVYVVYSETEAAFQIYRIVDDVQCKLVACNDTTTSEFTYAIGCNTGDFSTYSYWEIYEIVETTGDDNTGDDNTGDDNTGDDNTGDDTTETVTSLSAVTAIETGKSYVVVNKATGTVLTNTVETGEHWYSGLSGPHVLLGTTPTVDSETWIFEDYDGDTTTTGDYAMNGVAGHNDGTYLKINTVNVQVVPGADLWGNTVYSVVYDETQAAFQIYRMNDTTTYKLVACNDLSGNFIYAIGCDNSSFDAYSYWVIYEVTETTGDDNTGDDNTGDDNTGDDNTGDDNTGDDNTGDDNTESDVELLDALELEGWTLLDDVNQIQDGTSYLIVSASTNRMMNSNFSYEFTLGDTPTATSDEDYTNLWQFAEGISGLMRLTDANGTTEGYYQTNNGSGSTSNITAASSNNNVTAAYMEDAGAWLIFRINKGDTFYFMADTANSTVVSAGGSSDSHNAQPTDDCYWYIYGKTEELPTISTEKVESTDSTKPNFSFAFSTDIHVGNDSDGTKVGNVKTMYQDFAKLIKEGVELDTILISGDITQLSSLGEWLTAATAIEYYTPAGITTYSTMGNHDARSWDYTSGDSDRTEAERWAELYEYYDDFTNRTSPDVDVSSVPYYHVEIPGHNGTTYDLITLCTEGPEKDSAYLSDTQIAWFEDTLESIEAKKGTHQNIIVMLHQPVNGTVLTTTSSSYHIGDANDTIKSIIAEHPQVVYISGHIHTSYTSGKIVNEGEGIYVDGIALTSQSYYRVIEIYDNSIQFRIRGIDGTWLTSYTTTIDTSNIGSNDTTGDDNTGDDNTGDDTTGDDNTGDDNTGDDTTSVVPTGWTVITSDTLSTSTSDSNPASYALVNAATGKVLTVNLGDADGVSDDTLSMEDASDSSFTWLFRKSSDGAPYFWYVDSTGAMYTFNPGNGNITLQSGRIKTLTLEYNSDMGAFRLYRTGGSGDYILQVSGDDASTVTCSTSALLGEEYTYWYICELPA